MRLMTKDSKRAWVVRTHPLLHLGLCHGESEPGVEAQLEPFSESEG